jgi:putative transcriptional regulator
MATVRKTRGDLKASPFKFSPKQRARLDAMTDEEIARAAEADPDNPPLTDEELERMATARAARRARRRTELSQREFAERFHFNLRRLQDLEQGRTARDPALEAYFKVIEKEPDLVERIINAA